MTTASLKITATFWDCGGVLLTNGWDHVARRQVVEHFGLDFEEFEQRHDGPNDQWERGRISLHDYLMQTVFYVSRQFSETQFIAQMRAVSKILYPELLTFLQSLRSNCSLNPRACTYLLSNESRELMEYRIPTFHLSGLFDAYLVSAYIGLRKPEAAFFQCALDIAQRTPEECVFIDDREENVAAARKLGIHGICLETPQQVMEGLGRFGIAAA